MLMIDKNFVISPTRGLDVTGITVALSHANEYPRAYQALSSMLSRKALNPADITVVRHTYVLYIFINL